MASQDDLLRIILDVQGEEEVRRAQKTIDQERDSIRQLDAALKAGTITQAQFAAGATQSAAAIQAAQQKIKDAQKSFNGQALMEFSRGLEDAQYGISGVVNNIPGLVTAMGGGAGIAGAASLAAIAIAQLVKHWDELAGLFGLGHVKTQAEEMEDLRKKTSLAADEAERLRRAEAPGAKAKELQTARTAAERQQDSDVTAAIVEAGAENVAKGILKVAPELVDSQGDAAVAKGNVNKAREELSYFQAEKAKAAPGSEAAEGIDDEIEAAQRKLTDALVEQRRARNITAQQIAAAGTLADLFPGGLAQLQGLVQSNPDAFGPKGNQLRKDLGDIKTPEDEEDEKAEDYAQAEERDYRSKLAAWQNEADEKARQEDEAAEQKALNDRDAFSQWEEAGRQRLADQLVQAKTADIIENVNRTSQVLNGPAQLRDSIQGAVGKHTNEEMLKVLQDAESQARRQVELLQSINNRVGGPARAG